MKDDRKKWIYTTDVAVTTVQDGKKFILLIRRAKDPHEGKLALPGGHVETEHPDFGNSAKAAIRELREETCISAPIHLLELFAVLDGIGRDSRGPTMSAVYWLKASPLWLMAAKPQSDAGAVIIRELDRIQPEEMAFDHFKIIELLLARGGRR